MGVKGRCLLKEAKEGACQKKQEPLGKLVTWFLTWLRQKRRVSGIVVPHVVPNVVHVKRSKDC